MKAITIFVIPAKAGIQLPTCSIAVKLDSRLRGNGDVRKSAAPQVRGRADHLLNRALVVRHVVMDHDLASDDIGLGGFDLGGHVTGHQ
jgi:hypothetical protein